MLCSVAFAGRVVCTCASGFVGIWALAVAMEMSAGVAAAASGLKRRWIKYYCEECEAWETREMFEVVKFEASASASSSNPSAASSASTVWSWGCAKLIRHGTFQSFRVEQLNNADGHDVVAPKLDFPASPVAVAPAPVVQEPPPPPSPQLQPPPPPAEAEALPANSNGSSRPKRNVRSAYARESPLNSQGGVTSSSPDEVVPHENGTSKDVAPESPAVIDAEQHNENGAQKRPRRLTAGDRGLAQALQFERPRKVATPTTPKVAADVKPSVPSLAAAMKRPKRVTAGLKGIAIAAENAKSGTPRQPSVKKEPRKDQVHQVSVQTRSASASKPSKKNKKVGDLY